MPLERTKQVAKKAECRPLEAIPGLVFAVAGTTHQASAVHTCFAKTIRKKAICKQVICKKALGNQALGNQATRTRRMQKEAPAEAYPQVFQMVLRAW